MSFSETDIIAMIHRLEKALILKEKQVNKLERENRTLSKELIEIKVQQQQSSLFDDLEPKEAIILKQKIDRMIAKIDTYL